MQSAVSASIDKVATYDDYASLTRVTRVPVAAAVPSLSGGKASPRFGVAGHPAAVCNAPVSSRPPAYVPYASMAMTPSDVMHQQICYQGILHSSHFTFHLISPAYTNSLFKRRLPLDKNYMYFIFIFCHKVVLYSGIGHLISIAK